MNQLMLRCVVAAMVTAFMWTAQGQDVNDLVTVNAYFEIEKGTRLGRLVVDCELPVGRHVYSLVQPSPPGPTRIKITENKRFKLTGDFAADREPVVNDPDPVFGSRIEMFYDRVTFTAPVEFADDPVADPLVMEMYLACQVCSDTDCIMIRDKKVIAEFKDYYEPEPEAEDKKKQLPVTRLVPRDE